MGTKFSSKRPLTAKEEAEIQRMIAADPDAPEATAEELAQARPFRDVFPEIAVRMDAEIARRGRPKADRTKTSITIRLDPDLVLHLKATGKGWQSRVNDTLRKAVGI